MNRAGCDEKSVHINRGSLVERTKNTGWENRVDGGELAIGQANEARAAEPGRDDENCETNPTAISTSWLLQMI
jgi:hypothetical protein